MDEKIKQIWPKTKEFFAKMSKKTKRLLAFGIGGVVLVAAALLIFLATRPYATLFTGLNADNMQAVITYLNNAGVHNYRIQNNDTILVPESQEAALKMNLLMEGYPNQDSGYAMYLDNISSISTNPDRQTLFIFDLQERLRGAIQNIDGVRDAVVTITRGEDNSYILNRNAVIEASASVQVTMDPGRNLSQTQASAIRRLVAYAVSGLVVDNVYITDDYGNSYDYDVDGLNVTDAAKLKLALEEMVNRKLRANILTVLEPMYGINNVNVSVNTTVDVSEIYIDDIDYTEPDWAADGSANGRGIIGTRVWSYSLNRNEDGGVGGVVGADPNAELSTYVERAALNDESLRDIEGSGQDDYLVDTTRTQRKSPGGTITDVMVAVTINADPAQGFTQEFRQDLIGHIARAAGITTIDQNEKVSLLVGQFWEEPGGTTLIPENDFMWMIYAAIAGLIVFLLLLLIILLILRRRRKKRKAAEEQAAALDAAAAALLAAQNGQPEASADIMDIHTERSMELRKDVRKFAENNPEIAALMIKNWMNEDDKK